VSRGRPDRSRRGATAPTTDAGGHPRLDPEDLIGAEAVRIYEEMLLSAPVATGWRAVENSALASTSRWVADDDGDGLARKMADWAQDSWEQVRGGPESLVRRALRHAPIGFALFELMYHRRPDGMWRVDYEDRAQSSVSRWIVDPRTELLAEVEQFVIDPTAGSLMRRIPADKCLLLSHRATGQDFGGIGWCRDLYPDWIFRDEVVQMLRVGVRRWAIPTPVVEIDERAAATAGVGSTELDAMIAAAQDTAEAYLADGSGYLSATPMVKFEAFGSHEWDSSSTLKVIEHYDYALLRGFFAQFLQLAGTSAGSKSTIDGLVSQFTRAVMQLLDYVASQVRASLAKCAAYNWGDAAASRLPWLRFDGLDMAQLMATVPHLVGLAQAGFLTPITADAAHLRAGLRMPIPGPGDVSLPVPQPVAPAVPPPEESDDD